jgi:hypothetical protein
MMLLPDQDLDVTAIAKVAFTSEDRVRDVISNFNADRFGSLYPKYRGSRPPKFTLAQRRRIKKIADAHAPDYDLLFSPGACPGWPSSLWHRGGRRDQPRGPAHCAQARSAHHLSRKLHIPEAAPNPLARIPATMAAALSSPLTSPFRTVTQRPAHMPDGNVRNK